MFRNIISHCTNCTNYTINYSVLNRFLVSHPPIILDRNLLSWVHISIRYRCGHSVQSVCPFSLLFSSSFLFYKIFLCLLSQRLNTTFYLSKRHPSIFSQQLSEVFRHIYIFISSTSLFLVWAILYVILRKGS